MNIDIFFRILEQEHQQKMTILQGAAKGKL